MIYFSIANFLFPLFRSGSICMEIGKWIHLEGIAGCFCWLQYSCGILCLSNSKPRTYVYVYVSKSILILLSYHTILQSSSVCSPSSLILFFVSEALNNLVHGMIICISFLEFHTCATCLRLSRPTPFVVGEILERGIMETLLADYNVSFYFN